MKVPLVVIIFTGGTISMRSQASGGNVPSLSGAELMGLVPGLDRSATLELVEWGLVPGSHLTFDGVLDIGRTALAHLERPEVHGVVIVQGTDNIEETAFAWDLLPLPPKPFIVVGAMRSASQNGYDGPTNLQTAIVAAADSALGGQGVVVAMAGELHGADAAQKTHTHSLETFKSRNAGRLGTVADGRLHLSRRRQPFRLPGVPDKAGRVFLVTAVLDSGRVLPDELPDGLVVAAMGGGNTSRVIQDQARSLIERNVPVVLTTRCPTGQVRGGYSFEGGSDTWWEMGAIFSGELDALKSRVALSLAIGQNLSRDQLIGLFAHFNGGARS